MFAYALEIFALGCHIILNLTDGFCASLLGGDEVSGRIYGYFVEFVYEGSCKRVYDRYLLDFVAEEFDAYGILSISYADVNCVAADSMTPGLVCKLRRQVKGPLICKPNAGIPLINQDGIAEYPMGPEEFASICADCAAMGAKIIGGCCGTDPEFIRKLSERLG